MSTLSHLANSIDAAYDAGDVARLRQLGQDCQDQLASAEGQERVLVHYYRSNAYAGIVEANHRNANYTWSWQQPDGVQNILSLRRAIGESSFNDIDPVTICQIRTNLANRLNALGRPIAANEQWLRVLAIIPRFAKALASRAQAIAFYAQTIHDPNHVPLLLVVARSLFDTALANDALWESGDRDSVAPSLIDQRDRIADYLRRIDYDENYDVNQWPLGSSKKECSYRKWCLGERLFLNPLNEAYTDTVAATDPLHLPSHTYSIGEAPRFPGYYNLIKQEYISARYRLYQAIHGDDPGFLMRDVLMLDSGESQALGHYTEKLRSAFRSSYAVFDKIGLFFK